MADPKPNMAADCCADAAHAPHNRKVFVSAAPPISFNFVSFYTARASSLSGLLPIQNAIRYSCSQPGSKLEPPSLALSLSGCATKAQSYLLVTFLCQ